MPTALLDIACGIDTIKYTNYRNLLYTRDQSPGRVAWDDPSRRRITSMPAPGIYSAVILIT